MWTLAGIPRTVAERFAPIPQLEVESGVVGEGALLDGNAWTEPPSEVIQGGWSQIAGCYEDLARAGATTVHRLKVVLLGVPRENDSRKRSKAGRADSNDGMRANAWCRCTHRAVESEPYSAS